MEKSRIELRAKELIVLLKFIACRFISYILPKSDIWLISERGQDARDNAYVFYKYLRENHPEINARFIISNDSKDFVRFTDPQRLIIFGSFYHYLSLCRAPYLISTHIMGYTPWMDFFTTLDKKYNVFAKQKKIFLQHGITKDNLPVLKYGNIHLDLFCCGAKGEYEYVKNTFGHPDGVVQYTGLCRYDNLNNVKNKRQILVMPTWRMYINKQEFTETEYFKHWSGLLTSRELESYLLCNNYQLVFYPHYDVQKHIDAFIKLRLIKNVIIADFNYDVQTLLNESVLLITDYSSVYFDFAYMEKPVILFQFDESEFRLNHYQKGYFDEQSIGVKVYDMDTLLRQLQIYTDNGMKQADCHREFVESFFELADSRNCDRTFNSIITL